MRNRTLKLCLILFLIFYYNQKIYSTEQVGITYYMSKVNAKKLFDTYVVGSYLVFSNVFKTEDYTTYLYAKVNKKQFEELSKASLPGNYYLIEDKKTYILASNWKNSSALEETFNTNKDSYYLYPITDDHIIEDMTLKNSTQEQVLTMMLDKNDKSTIVWQKDDDLYHLAIKDKNYKQLTDYYKTQDKINGVIFVYNLSFSELLEILKKNYSESHAIYLPESTVYDLNGYNQYGKDRYGYNQYGRNDLGYDRSGRDAFGFNNSGFNQQQTTKYGHKVLASSSNNQKMHVKNSVGKISVQPIKFSAYSRNQAGFMRPIPKKYHMNSSESYNNEGYNPDGYNFLGVSKKDFLLTGYDTIVTNDMISNLGREELVAKVQKDCFPLQDIIMLEPIENFNALHQVVMSIKGYEDITEDELESYLRKTLHVFKYFYPRNKAIKPLKHLVITKNIQFFDRPMAPDIEWVLSYYAEKMAIKEPYSVIVAALSDPRIVSKAKYPEVKEQQRYNDSNKLEHLSKALTSVLEGQELNLIFMLFRIASVIDSVEEHFKVNALIRLIHAGGHCSDARREAVSSIYRGWFSHDNKGHFFEELDEYFIGTGVPSRLQYEVYRIKSQYFRQWIAANIESLSHNDDRKREQATTMASTWDYYAHHFGLAKEGHSYTNFELKHLNKGAFFSARRNQVNISTTKNGSYTPTTLASEIQKTAFFKKLKQKLLGPLADISITPWTDHPFTSGLLRKFGYISSKTRLKIFFNM